MSAVVSRERLAAAGSANALELRGVSRLFGALAALTDITPVSYTHLTLPTKA